MENNTKIGIRPGTLVYPKEGSLFKKELDIRSQDNTTILAKKANRPYVVLSPEWMSKFLGIIWVVPQKSLSSFNVKNKIFYEDETNTLRELLAMQMCVAEADDVTISKRTVPLQEPTKKAIALIIDQLNQALDEISAPALSQTEILVVHKTGSNSVDIEKLTAATPVDKQKQEKSASRKKPVAVDKKQIYEEIKKGTPRKEILKKFNISTTTLFRREKEYMSMITNVETKKTYDDHLPLPEPETKVETAPQNKEPFMSMEKHEIDPISGFVTSKGYRGGYIIDRPPLKYPNFLVAPKKLHKELKDAYYFLYLWKYLPNFEDKYPNEQKSRKLYEQYADLLKSYNLPMP